MLTIELECQTSERSASYSGTQKKCLKLPATKMVALKTFTSVFHFTYLAAKIFVLLGFKSDGQEKSTKILISWQELKNQFLSFFVHR